MHSSQKLVKQQSLVSRTQTAMGMLAETVLKTLGQESAPAATAAV
jgi:hypothetical protein